MPHVKLMIWMSLDAVVALTGDATAPTAREKAMKWSFKVSKEEIKDFSYMLNRWF